MSRIGEFEKFREQINETILASDNRTVKRFFALDSEAYRGDGALPVETKEMLGLVASMVLRCDDCVTYHLIRCWQEGVSREELFEVFAVALVVGGSIVIPHMRRAVAILEELQREH